MSGSILEELDIEEVIGSDYIDDSIDEEDDAEADLMYDEDEALIAVLMTDPEFADLACCGEDGCDC